MTAAKELSKEKVDTRNVAMFRRWMEGATYADLAKEFELHPQTIVRIAADNKWQDYRKKLRDRLYSDVIESLQDRIVGMVGVITKDLDFIERQKQGGKKQKELSPNERAHILKVFEIFLNEYKLKMGQPTAITSNETTMRVILPEGAPSPFIIPPDPSVIVEYEKKEEKKADLISDAEFEELVDKQKGKPQ